MSEKVIENQFQVTGMTCAACATRIEKGLNKKERLILLNQEANREKELFNKNKEKTIYKLENKQTEN